MRTLRFGRVVGAVIALGAVVLIAAPAAAQVVDLRPKFKAGQDTTYKMTISQTAKSKSKEADLKEMGGDEKSDLEITFSLKVKSVDNDGNAAVDLVYDSVKKVGEVNGEKVSVDSTKPATTDKGEGAAGLRAMAGTTMSLEIDKNGNITRATGGGGLLGGAGGAGGDLFGPIFSPGKSPGEVKRGQSWTHVDEIGMGELMGAMRLVTTHTLESASNGEARVRTKGTIEAGEKSPGGKDKSKPTTDMVQITKSDHSGGYVWDTERGQLKSMNSAMKSEIKIDFGGLDMTRTGDQTMKLERVSTDPIEKPVDKPKGKDKSDPKPDDDGNAKAPKPKR